MSEFNFFILKGQTEDGHREFECTPDNTELYLHHEQYEDVDHIFHRIDETDRRLGAFVWRHVLGEESFEEHADMMCESGLWTVMYRPEPVESDLNQFAQDFLDVPDELPEDWK